MHVAVDAGWVRKSGFAKQEITDKECQVVCLIVNTLRPYVPRRRRRTIPDGTRVDSPPPNVCLRAPIVLIANAVLRITNHSEFTRKVVPHSSTGTPSALILGPQGFYETLCRKLPGFFDAHDHKGDIITNIAHVTSPSENKRAVIGGFLDMERVDKICRDHDLIFQNR